MFIYFAYFKILGLEMKFTEKLIEYVLSSNFISPDTLKNLVATSDATGEENKILLRKIRELAHNTTLRMIEPSETGQQRPELHPAIETSFYGNKYKLGKLIDRGGQGEIWEAEDSLGRTVAIKMPLPDTAPEDLERFVSEGLVTAQLEHPNIVPVHDVGVILDKQGKHRKFFAMKKVEGRNLKRIIRDSFYDKNTHEEYTRARMISILQQVCLGVEYAHQRDVIHRDLKPANVIVGEFGEVYVLDWGLEKVIEEPEPLKTGSEPEQHSEVSTKESTHITKRGAVKDTRKGKRDTDRTIPGEIMGTPSNMPPEQAKGDIEKLDARSDVYSICTILYEMLTGHTPHEGESARDVALSVMSKKIMPPNQRILSMEKDEIKDMPFPHEPVHRELEEACMKGLAFKQEDRFQSTRELHDALQGYLEGKTPTLDSLEKKASEDWDKGTAILHSKDALLGTDEELDRREKAGRTDIWDLSFTQLDNLFRQAEHGSRYLGR